MTSTSRLSTGLFWFRHDLRLDDNPALNALCTRVGTLVCLYVINPADFAPGRFHARSLGEHRWSFLSESLLDLQEQLQARGQHLDVRIGDPAQQLTAAINEYDASVIGVNHHPGVDERRALADVRDLHPHCEWIERHAHTLFTPERLPFPLRKLPRQFTPFCRQVEDDTAFCPPEAAPAQMPSPSGPVRDWPSGLPPAAMDGIAPWVGGSRAGMAHWQEYLDAPHPVRHYKRTRNALDERHASSVMSPWLANGSVSVRRLAQDLRAHEAEHDQNESTHWLYREWLWREYFQWHLELYGTQLFRFAGTRGKRPLTTLYPARLKAWQEGETGLPLVDACMRQLRDTGWMSNRGRQIVASALVNELGVDWRYGAAWFEQQLLDFDVASNYGNWQYIAGVGVDPRGGRHFNLEHQARQYDPDGAFQRRWLPDGVTPPVDDGVDMVDWPRDPGARS